MKIRLYPGHLKGKIEHLPSGKSMLQRYIIASALADGVSTIRNYSPCNDAEAALSCARTLGADIAVSGDTLTVTGCGGIYASDDVPVFECGESAAVLRFMLPVAAAVCGKGMFRGSGRLFERPVEPFLKLFEKHGMGCTFRKDSLELSGRLDCGEFSLPGNVSSQFFSGLLFALPLCGGRSQITAEGQLESAGYADMTLEVIKQFGIRAEKLENGYGISEGGYRAADVICPGDSSAAAFWQCADFIGNEIEIPETGDILSPDSAAPELFRRLDSDGDITLPLSMTPDMLPSLALAATQRKGGTLFSNAARLRFKESDRLHSVCSVLNSLGADIEELPDGLLVHGGKRLRGGAEVSSFGDHRIVMMEAVASTVCDGPVVIDGYECVAKSYPGFFDDFTVCGGKADVF